MKANIKLAFAISALFVFGNISGQNCSGIQNSMLCDIPAPNVSEFKYSSFSRSALVETKIPYKYSATLPPGKDYLIGVCCDSRFRPVKFRIIDLVKDSVIYDNSTDDYVENIGFTVEQNPMNLIIEVTVMANDVKPRFVDDKRCCVGIRILYRTIGKKGFY